MGQSSLEALLGQGGPWSQQRVDWNRLYGTDSSSGTNPFANPTNLNDGSDATHADRSADPHATLYIVQERTFDGSGAPATGGSFASPVTPGNTLVLVSHSSFGSFDPSGTSPAQVFLGDGSTARPFTDRLGVILQNIAGGSYFRTFISYRIATGDEQTLKILNQQPGSNFWYTLYELANAAATGLWSTVGPTNAQAASTAKPIGSLSAAGVLEIMALTYGIASGGDRPLDQTVGAGWVQDDQNGLATGGGQYVYNYASAHAFGRTDPNWSGGSTIWGGGAVGIPTNAADETSIMQADLGAARRVNRIRLLEPADSGTQYAISYSTDGGSTWTAVSSPTFATLGGGWQRYDFADVVARHWRIADNHSPAIALPTLTWDTWTIEGFPV